MPVPPDLSREIDVAAGRVDVLHRLALAVKPRDAVTARPVTSGIRVGFETSRTLAARPRRRGDPTPLDPVLNFPAVPLDTGAAFVLRHGYRDRTRVTLRVDDPERRWVPRRFVIPLWTAAEVEATDAVPPPASGPIPAESRLLLPWLLPGPAYPVTPGATGVQLRIIRDGVPVRWARVEVFGTGGHRIAWAHGDEHGQALLILAGTGAIPPPAPATFDVAIRVHAPDPGAVDPRDPLADLAVEPVTRSSAPPTAQDLDNDLLRGITPPSGYRRSPDVVVTLTVGKVIAFAHDITSP